MWAVRNRRHGQGITPQNIEVFNVFLRAAESGDYSAQVDVGDCYEVGDGVLQNLKEAVKWFHKSADQGFEAGQLSLALCYAEGRGVSKDNDEAAKWFKKAAQRGNSRAQYRLIDCYQYGWGVPIDLIEAYKWSLLAGIDWEEGMERASAILPLLTSEELATAISLFNNFEIDFLFHEHH